MSESPRHPSEASFPSDEDPAPVPERERPTVDEVETNEGVDRGGTGEPVGRDNISEGRVGGTMGGAHQQGGEGQGG